MRGDLTAEVRRNSVSISVAEVSGENAHRIPAYLFILLFIYLFIKFICRPSPVEHLWAAGNIARFHSAFQSLEKFVSQSLYLAFCCCWGLLLGGPHPLIFPGVLSRQGLCCLGPGLACPFASAWQVSLCVICARWAFENRAVWG